jgi:hypothetical protein
MPAITLNLMPEAAEYLKAKVGGKRCGHGNIVSVLLLCEKAREELRQARDKEPQSTKASWRESGCNVD